MFSRQPPSPAASTLLAFLFLFFCAGPALAKITLSLHLAPSAVLPQPQMLPPASTRAQLTNKNGTLTAPFRRTSRFVFADVPAGSYLCDVISHRYVFAPMRVDVGDDGAVAVWHTFRGNEWSNTGEQLANMPGRSAAAAEARDVDVEVPVTVIAQRKFYEDRPAFNPMSLLSNPMILIGGLALLMMFGMPKLIENMDPEMREEFEKQQSSSPLAALTGGMAGGGAPNTGFDMAAWMAGSDKKEQGKSSGSEGGQAKRRR